VNQFVEQVAGEELGVPGEHAEHKFDEKLGDPGGGDPAFAHPVGDPANALPGARADTREGCVNVKGID
jgi:hypothetical protein